MRFARHVAIASLAALATRYCSLATAYGAAYGGDGAVRELLEEGPKSVIQEAFDSEGKSLGYAHDAEANWSPSQIGLVEREGDAPFMYHNNASYYIVGTNGTIVEFWHPFDDDRGGKDMACVHLNVAARMVAEFRDEEGRETMRIKVVNAGWTGVANAPILCDENGGDCPALVLAGTTHIASRHECGDALSLNAFLADWALEKGWILTDDFIKFFYYDFNYGGNWMAVPLVSDTRILAYNITTFKNHGIATPPGLGAIGRWDWEKFVRTAEELTVATGRPGWYFKGSWDEEAKMSLTIARNWGTSLYAEDEQELRMCALGDKFLDAMNSTVEVMLREGWMSADFIPTDTVAFEDWLDADLEDPIKVTDSVHCCVDPAFDNNTSNLWGMAIVPPGTLKEILVDGDIGEAFVPGRYSFLGGSGLFISKAASEEQQAYGWHLMKAMIDMASTYALVQRSPPPYESVLSDEAVWSSDEWALRAQQLRESVPAQYPQPGFFQFRELENVKPFRTMWMEMYYKGLNVVDAANRLETRLNQILEVTCTEDDHTHASCRECDDDDFNYTVTPCDPATQTVGISFAYDPQGDLCFGGKTMPNITRLECDHVEMCSSFGIMIIMVSCVGGVIAFGSAVLVYVYRDRPVIKFSQPTFCVLFSLGVAGLCLSNLSLLGTNTSVSCFTRVALWGIAFDLTFGALFSKVYRVRALLSNVKRSRKRTRRSFFSLMSVVSLAVVVDIVILSLWAVFDDLGPFTKSVMPGGTRASVEMSECASEASSWVLAFVAFKIALIVWGVYLAWVTRKVNYALVEGRQISWSIYLFAVLAAILILIGSSGLQIEYWALAKAFVFCLSSCTALVMVLMPKLWAAHKRLEVDVSLLTHSASSVTMRAGSIETFRNNDAFDQEDGSHEPWTVVCTHCHQETDGKRGYARAAPATAANAGRTLWRAGKTTATHPRRNPHLGDMFHVETGGAAPGGERPKGRGALHREASLTPSTDADGGCVSTDFRGNLWSFSGDSFGSEEKEQRPLSLPPTPSSGGGDRVQCRIKSDDGGDDTNQNDGGGGGVTLQRMATAFRSGDGRPGRFRISRGVVDDPVVSLPAHRRHKAGSARVAARVLPRADGLEGTGSSGLAAAAAAAGARSGAPKRVSWRGIWRSSNESGQSSSSGQSEMDAASFARSIQAQALTLRAALWGSSNSSAEQKTSDRGSRRSRGSSCSSSSGGGGNGSDLKQWLWFPSFAVTSESDVAVAPTSTSATTVSVQQALPAVLPLVKERADAFGGNDGKDKMAEAGPPPVSRHSLSLSVALDSIGEGELTSDTDQASTSEQGGGSLGFVTGPLQRNRPVRDGPAWGSRYVAPSEASCNSFASLGMSSAASHSSADCNEEEEESSSHFWNGWRQGVLGATHPKHARTRRYSGASCGDEKATARGSDVDIFFSEIGNRSNNRSSVYGNAPVSTVTGGAAMPAEAEASGAPGAGVKNPAATRANQCVSPRTQITPQGVGGKVSPKL